MARKITNKGSVGAADEFATDDIDYINKLLTGVDQSSTDPVPMNTTWTFGHGKAKIRNSGDTASTTVNTATTTNNTITLPNETGTVLTSATANVVKNDQNNDLGDFYLDFGDIAVPSNPASGKVRIFFNTATGELSVRKSGGTTVSLESGGGGTWDPAAVETLTNKTIVFANNTLTNVASTNTAQTFSAVKTFSSAPVISTITNTGTLTLPTSTDTLVGRATTDTLTNKTLTTPIISSISNSGTVTIPTGTDTLVNLAGTQTLTGKTISGGSNTLSNIPKSAIPAATVYNDQNNALGAFYEEISEIAAPSAPASAASVRLYMDSTTHKLSVRKFGGTTVSLEEQAAGSTWDPAAVETLTNKTIAFASNTLTNVASTNTAQTFSAVKTFSSAPVISTITNTGTLTLPTSTDTLVGRDTTDTLTGKTIAFGSNTLTDVASTNTAQSITAAKTFDSGTIKIKNVAGTFAYTINGGTNTTDVSLSIPLTASTDTLATTNATQTFVSNPKKFAQSVLRLRNPANTFDYIFSTSAITTADKTVTFPLLLANDTLVFENHIQTLVGKTLTSPTIDSPTLTNSGNAITLPTTADTLVGRATTDTLTNKILTTPQIATIKPDSSHALNLPIIDDTLVSLTAPQTLTTKSMSGSSNTFTNIPKSAIPSSTVYNDQNNLLGAFYQEISEIAAPGNPGSTARRIYMDSTTHKLSVRTNAGTSISLEEQPNWSASTAETLTNKTIDYSTNTLTGVASTTTAQTLTNKTLQGAIIKPDGSTTWTIPVVTDQAVGRDTTDTLTNKTLTTPTIASVKPDGSATLTFPARTDTVVTLGGTETLTAKTLTSPTVNSPTLTNSGNTLTLPTTADTLVGLATTDTLINKTIDAASNTFRNVRITPDLKISGAFYATGIGAGSSVDGFLIGSVQSAPANQVTPTSNTTTEGKFSTYSTRTASTAAGDQGGWRTGTGGSIIRYKNPRFKTKFRCLNTSTVRYMIGLTSSTGSYMSGDTPLASQSGVIFTVRSTDTNFQVAYNSGTATATYVNPPNSSGTPTAIAIDTNVHTFEVVGDEAGGGWKWALDGGAFTTLLTSGGPAQTTKVVPEFVVETSNTTGKTMDIWYVYVEQDA